MIIAIPTNDKVNVSDVFGRALNFVLYNTETKTTTILNNEANAALLGGAGLNTAQALINNKVNTILTIDFGPKAKDALKDKNITVEYLEKVVTIEEALLKFK